MTISYGAQGGQTPATLFQHVIATCGDASGNIDVTSCPADCANGFLRCDFSHFFSLSSFPQFSHVFPRFLPTFSLTFFTCSFWDACANTVMADAKNRHTEGLPAFYTACQAVQLEATGFAHVSSPAIHNHSGA